MTDCTCIASEAVATAAIIAGDCFARQDFRELLEDHRDDFGGGHIGVIDFIAQTAKAIEKMVREYSGTELREDLWEALDWYETSEAVVDLMVLVMERNEAQTLTPETLARRALANRAETVKEHGFLHFLRGAALPIHTYQGPHLNTVVEPVVKRGEGFIRAHAGDVGVQWVVLKSIPGVFAPADRVAAFPSEAQACTVAQMLANSSA